MAEYLPQLLLAWSIQLMGVISPGPSVMLILGVATAKGRFPSLVTAFGVACASIVFATATVLGVALLFAEMAKVIMAIRYIGAAYLLWLAYKAFRKACASPALHPYQSSSAQAWHAGVDGFVLQLSNPKAIFFWLAVASVGGVGNAPTPILLLFVAGAFVNSFVGHGAYALLLSSAPVRHLYVRFANWIEGALGCFFLFAGYTLAKGQG